MNNRKVFSLSYFLGRTFFLGFGFSLLGNILNKDAWLACVLGIFLGAILIFVFQKLKSRTPNSLKELKHWLKWPFVFLFFLFNFALFLQILFIFQTFTSSFLLIHSPVFYITLPIPFILFRICKTSYPNIAKVAEVIMPISIFLTFLSILGLVQYFKLDHFLPLITSSTFNLIKGTFLFTVYSTAPFFLLLNTNTKENKLVLKYLFSTGTILLTCFCIIAILGPNLIQMYRYPEYIVLKKIKIFNFIEKVENIISISWLFDLFISLSLAGANLKEMLPVKRKELWFIFVLILLYFGSLLTNYFYQYELMVYYWYPLLLASFEMIFFLFLFFLPKKKVTT